MKKFTTLLAGVFFAVSVAGTAFADVDAIDNYLTVTDDIAAPEDFPLTDWMLIDPYGYTVSKVIDNDGTTNPGIAIVDYVPAIVYANDEITTIARSFRVPKNYPGGLAFEITGSTSSASTLPTIAWALRFNTEDTAFSTTRYNQTGVAFTNTSSTTQNEIVALRINSTAEAALKQLLKGGKDIFCTVEINNSVSGTGTLEIKQIRKVFHNYK